MEASVLTKKVKDDILEINCYNTLSHWGIGWVQQRTARKSSLLYSRLVWGTRQGCTAREHKGNMSRKHYGIVSSVLKMVT